MMFAYNLIDDGRFIVVVVVRVKWSLWLVWWGEQML